MPGVIETRVASTEQGGQQELANAGGLGPERTTGIMAKLAHPEFASMDLPAPRSGTRQCPKAIPSMDDQCAGLGRTGQVRYETISC
jgi:hypothetical protein